MWTKLTIYLVLFVTPGLQTSDGVDKSWDELMLEGTALSKVGKYSEAVSSFERAIGVANEFQTGDRRLLQTIDALASAYADAGRFADSGYQYRRGLSLLAKSGGRDSLDYALLLGSLASTQPQELDVYTTIRVIQGAIASGSGSVEEVNSLRNYLFQIYKDQGWYREAECTLLDQQIDFEKRSETDCTKKATLLNNFGLLRFNAKRYEEARAFYEESLRMREASGSSHDPRLIEPLNNLAASLVGVGRFQEADSVFQRAVSLCRETLGIYHPVSGVTLTNYAVCLRRLGRKKKASQIEAEAKQILAHTGRQNAIGRTVSVEALRSTAR